MPVKLRKDDDDKYRPVYSTAQGDLGREGGHHMHVPVSPYNPLVNKRQRSVSFSGKHHKILRQRKKSSSVFLPLFACYRRHPSM
eukprot:scaffold64_cov150-Amphora_coffeaeformis.AAC.4